MELIFVMIGMGIEFFGVLILTMNANWLMKYLITKPLVSQSETLDVRIPKYLDKSKRRTIGGIILFMVGFFIQIIGMAVPKIFFI